MPRDHYIPQFYLKNFSKSKSDKIQVYERNSKGFITNVKNVAAENNFYTVVDRKTGESYRVIESFFSEVEGDVAPIIKKLLEADKINISTREKEILATFTTLLFIRDLRFREKLKNFYSEFMKNTMAILVKNREAYRRYIERGGIHFNSDKEFEGHVRFIEEKAYDLSFDSEEYFLGISIQLGIDCTPFILNKTLQILIIENKNFFITSDSPVTLFRESKVPNPFGLGFLWDSIILPISPSRCLIFCDNDGAEKEILECTQEKVNLININTVKYANKFLFADRYSEEIQDIFNKTSEEESTRVSVQMFGNYLVSSFEKR